MARAGRKRKPRGHNPATKQVEGQNTSRNVLGTPELMARRADAVGVYLRRIDGKYEAYWLEDGIGVTQALYTDDLQLARQRLSMVPRIKAFDGTPFHALVLLGSIDPALYDVGKKVKSVVKKFATALRMMGGPVHPHAGGGNFIGDVVPDRTRSDWDCEDFLDMKAEYNRLMEMMTNRERRMIRALNWDYDIADVEALVSALKKAGGFFGMLGRDR